MAHALDIRSFFRKAPRDWLCRYFAHHGVLADYDWSTISRYNVEPLHVAFQAIDMSLQERMVADFRNIAMLGTPSGKLAIIDEAAFHGEIDGFAEKLSELEDLLACAFWTYIERPKYWDGAVFFAAADSKPRRYWRTRVNLPRLGRAPTSADGEALGSAIARDFKRREGRGGHCVVHILRRGDREHYFVYPQDHRQTSIEYEVGGAMTKRPYNPAFELILIHDDNAGTLDIWHHGSIDRVKDLQVIFAQTVLGTEIPRERPIDARVYDLNSFLNGDFKIKAAAELGIRSVSLRKLRIHVQGDHKCTIRIDLAPDCPQHVLIERLNALTHMVPPSLLRVSQVGLAVEFELRDGEKKARRRPFEISWPNSCSLERDGDDAVLRRILKENGIEPRAPPAEGSDASKA